MAFINPLCQPCVSDGVYATPIIHNSLTLSLSRYSLAWGLAPCTGVRVLIEPDYITDTLFTIHRAYLSSVPCDSDGVHATPITRLSLEGDLSLSLCVNLS